MPFHASTVHVKSKAKTTPKPRPKPRQRAKLADEKRMKQGQTQRGTTNNKPSDALRKKKKGLGLGRISDALSK